MTEPLVSWLIPAYNAESTIGRAMDSVLAQDYKNFVVVVVVEDGCTDGTPDILDAYVRKDERVAVIHNTKNLGVAKSLNKGLLFCGGKYIARMDADDYSYPDRLTKQVRFMEENPDIDLLGTQMRVIRTDDLSNITVSQYPLTPDQIKLQILFYNLMSHPTLMLRGNGFNYPDAVAEDYALYALMYESAKMANLPDVTVSHYVHGQNVTSTNKTKVIYDALETSKRLIARTFAIDICKYSDVYYGYGFGMGCSIRDDKSIVAQLLKSADLFTEIKNQNDRLGIFDKEAIESQLTKVFCSIKDDLSFSVLPYAFTEAKLISSKIEALKIIKPNDKVVIWGVGDYCTQTLLSYASLSMFDIIGFCDQSPQRIGNKINGVRVFSPDTLRTLDFKYIFIGTADYAKEVYDSLLNIHGIKDEQILPLVPCQTLVKIKEDKRELL